MEPSILRCLQLSGPFKTGFVVAFPAIRAIRGERVDCDPFAIEAAGLDLLLRAAVGGEEGTVRSAFRADVTGSYLRG